MTDNPYVAPQVVSTPLPPGELTLPARRVRSVARIFRSLGWRSIAFLALFTIIIFVLGMLEFITNAPVHIFGDLGHSIGSCVKCICVALFMGMYVKTAYALIEKSPRAKSKGFVLALILPTGFPLFTVFGIYCLLNLLWYYDDYEESSEIAGF
jgi:hypothetical protein